MGLGNRFFCDKLLSEFEEQLRHSYSLGALRDSMHNSISGLGFEAYAYVRVTRNQNGASEIEGLTNYPSAWCERYKDADYFAFDPTLRYCASELQPVAWHDLRASHAGDRAASILFEEAQGYGLRNGITIPLHGGDRWVSAMNVVTDVACREATQMVSAHMDMLHIMSIIFHGIADERIRSSKLSLPMSKVSLSNKNSYNAQMTGRRLQ